MSFGMIMQKQNMVKNKRKNNDFFIQTSSLSICKQMIFIKKLQKMLKQDLTIQVMS